MQKKHIIIGFFVIILFVGVIFLLSKREVRDGATFVESIRLGFDKEYETKELRANRKAIKAIHAENIRLIWSKNYAALEKRYAKPYIFFEDNEPVDFVAGIKKYASEPIFKTDVNTLYKFDTIRTFSYRQMIELGFAKEIGTTFIQEGDFFANLEPNPNSPESNKIESQGILYRNINGEWIAIGGFK